MLLPPSAGDASLLLGRQTFRPFLDKLVMMEILSYLPPSPGRGFTCSEEYSGFPFMALWAKPFVTVPQGWTAEQ